MKKRTTEIIEELADKLIYLKQPIHLLAVCSGGTTVAKVVASYLKKRRIKIEYYEVWTNIINGKSELWRTNFTKQNYTGTAVIIEDVIWKGRQLPPIKKMLKRMAPHRKFYLASLLDCNDKADFSVFK